MTHLYGIRDPPRGRPHHPLPRSLGRDDAPEDPAEESDRPRFSMTLPTKSYLPRACCAAAMVILVLAGQACSKTEQVTAPAATRGQFVPTETPDSTDGSEQPPPPDSTEQPAPTDSIAQPTPTAPTTLIVPNGPTDEQPANDATTGWSQAGWQEIASVYPEISVPSAPQIYNGEETSDAPGDGTFGGDVATIIKWFQYNNEAIVSFGATMRPGYNAFVRSVNETFYRVSTTGEYVKIGGGTCFRWRDCVKQLFIHDACPPQWESPTYSLYSASRHWAYYRLKPATRDSDDKTDCRNFVQPPPTGNPGPIYSGGSGGSGGDACVDPFTGQPCGYPPPGGGSTGGGLPEYCNDPFAAPWGCTDDGEPAPPPPGETAPDDPCATDPTTAGCPGSGVEFASHRSPAGLRPFTAGANRLRGVQVVFIDEWADAGLLARVVRRPNGGRGRITIYLPATATAQAWMVAVQSVLRDEATRPAVADGQRQIMIRADGSRLVQSESGAWRQVEPWRGDEGIRRWPVQFEMARFDAMLREKAGAATATFRGSGSRTYHVLGWDLSAPGPGAPMQARGPGQASAQS